MLIRGLLLSYGGLILVRSAMWWRRSAALRELAEKKHREREKARFKARAVLEAAPELPTSVSERNHILELSANALARSIKCGKLTATAVMATYCLRALDVGESIHCNAEEFFETALANAREADAHLAKVGPECVGVLFGVPISVKDNLNLPGFDSTCGTASRCFKPRSNTSVPVLALMGAGAIPFVKSNVPQSLMIPETVNAIWGRTTNPWNKERTPGGSSGGESALLSARASPLGIGTDIGGSIRIPAAFCGICSFKATPERVSSLGATAPRLHDKSGQTSIQAVAGPMARRVEDVVTVMQVWWTALDQDEAVGRDCAAKRMFANDSYVVPMPFAEKIYRSPRTEGPRVGFFEADGWFLPSPANQRAVRIARQRLEGLGYELVSLTVPDPFEYVGLYAAVMGADGGMRATTAGLDGEQLMPGYSQVKWMTSMPWWFKQAVASVLRMAGEHRKAHLISETGHKDALEYWHVNKRLKTYREAFARAMHDAGVKALICPAGVLPALPHGMSTKNLMTCAPFFLFNLLHMPAGVVPCTLVRPDECEYVDPSNQDSWARGAAECLRGSDGLPVAVQVAALPFLDELCLGLMRELEAVLGFSHTAPDVLAA